MAADPLCGVGTGDSSRQGPRRLNRAPGEDCAEGGGSLQCHPVACWDEKAGPRTPAENRSSSSHSSHFRPWMEMSVPRLTDHNMCLIKGISVGLEAGGRGHRSAPPGVLPLLSSPQGQCQRKSSAITLYPTDNMATPGGSRVPSQGDPRNPCECLRVSGLLEGHRDQNPPFPPNLKSQALETMGDKMSLGKVQRLVT